MIKYEYQILRYVHDQTSGEFVNVGIVIYEHKSKFLKAKVLNKFSRISNFFEELNGYFLLNTLKHFQKEIECISKDFSFFNSSEFLTLKESPSLKSITNKILLDDDSGISLTDVQFGLDVELDSAFNDLYERLVDKYNSDVNKEVHTDSHAWTKIYKTYFDKYGITPKLKDHTVKTHNDHIKFDKAWKNGVWNCYQSLAFDLKKEDSVKNKVYKWSGIIKELQSSNEKMNLYFLTTSPKESKQLNNFIKHTLTQKNSEVNVTIVTEDEAEQFASKVKIAIEKSILGN
ncbi:DUF3037 domain-containing protein [Mucilaginibacter pocheonensis]|uniref:DUF3037 domain-containing protein n=1 Tax=Mucilaginibacter pocheonensis TaxID=398050 RepID=A0ABU1T8G3_9SPHI|nr:DUF3037 domain-containing protein [Mucilaginibacter pocheonensis]MDR6941691.1 hypothetical protein [Mucilaginibacter pocheonensis]